MNRAAKIEAERIRDAFQRSDMETVRARVRDFMRSAWLPRERAERVRVLGNIGINVTWRRT